MAGRGVGASDLMGQGGPSNGGMMRRSFVLAQFHAISAAAVLRAFSACFQKDEKKRGEAGPAY